MQSTETSICSIIAAFTSGLDVFKRLRQRRKKGSNAGKGTKTGARPAVAPKQRTSEDEVRLTRSLRKGSADVYSAYAHHARRDGTRFSHGDSAAHASLAQTLLKLNSGLVSIIASFLTHGKHDVPVDYGSLTSLSDASRLEAIDAMEKLHSRLSRSQLALQPGTGGRKQQQQKKHQGAHTKAARTSERSPELPPGIAKVTVNSSQTQLAWSRPVKKRKSSTASSGGSTGHSGSKASSPPSSAPVTPLPAYSPPQSAYPFPPPAQQLLPTQHHHHQPHTQSPSPSAGANNSAGIAAAAGAPPQPTMTPRRQDKVTPSFYSFATDSTKLGEIPMRKWTSPFDQVEADRLNAIALANGWRPPVPPPTLEQQQKGRFRLMKLFGKGAGGGGK